MPNQYTGPISSICRNGHNKDVVGRNGSRSCKACKRNGCYKLYGYMNSDGSVFTTLDYDRLYQIQQGRCAICSRHQLKATKRFDVDHNHKTGTVRGLLCSRCNTDLGRKEDAAWNIKADTYLSARPPKGK